MTRWNLWRESGSILATAEALCHICKPQKEEGKEELCRHTSSPLLLLAQIKTPLLSRRLSGCVQPVGASMADASMPILLLVLGILLSPSLSLRCPKSVSSFSASVSPGHYYTCTPERVAVLNRCPEGQIYHDKKKVIKKNLQFDTASLQECTKSHDEPEIIGKLLTLGRSVRIGSLYDHR